MENQTNQRYSKFSIDIVYVILANIITNVVGFLQLIVLTKWLGTELYGIWSVINITIMLISPIALLGYGTSIIRFLTTENNLRIIKDDFYSACVSILSVGLVLSVLLYMCADIISIHIFKDPYSSNYIRISSVLIILNSLHSVTISFFRLRRRIKLYSFIIIIQYVSQLILIYLILLNGFELNGVVIGTIVNWFLFLLINFIVIFKQIGIQVPKFTNLSIYLKYGIPLIPNVAILWIINMSNRYMISYFLNMSETGVYSAAYTIGNQASFLLGAITVVLFPAISNAFDSGKLQETRNYLSYSLKYFILFTIPATFGLWALSKPLIELFTTSEFSGGTILIPIFGISSVFSGIFQIYIYIVHLFKKTHYTFWILTFASALNIFLNIILIPILGILGSGIATLTAFISLAILTIIITRKYFTFQVKIYSLIKCCISAIVMAFALKLINPSSLLSFGGSIVVGFLLYLSLIMLLRVVEKKEINFFMSLLHIKYRWE